MVDGRRLPGMGQTRIMGARGRSAAGGVIAFLEQRSTWRQASTRT